jgi:hypothetical protein
MDRQRSASAKLESLFQVMTKSKGEVSLDTSERPGDANPDEFSVLRTTATKPAALYRNALVD